MTNRSTDHYEIIFNHLTEVKITILKTNIEGCEGNSSFNIENLFFFP